MKQYANDRIAIKALNTFVFHPSPVAETLLAFRRSMEAANLPAF